MAVENPPFALQNAAHSAALFRRAVSSTYWDLGGVIDPGDLQVAETGTPSLGVQVAEGQAFIPGQPGMYYVFNDGSVVIPIVPNSSGNPRIDSIIATVNDSEYAGSANNWVITVVEGTPASSPSPPALPAVCLQLADIAVSNGAGTITTGDITDRRPFLRIKNPGRGNPVARLHASAQTILADSTLGQIDLQVSDFASGGATAGSNAIVVPITGYYQISGGVLWQSAGGVVPAGAFQLFIYENGTQIRQWNNNTASPDFAGVTGSDTVLLAAGSTITLWASQETGTPIGTDVSGDYTYLSVALVSQ